MKLSFFKPLFLLSLVSFLCGIHPTLAQPPETGKRKCALSIAGGGVWGIVSARILQEIETRTGKRIHELFDVITGNSTGGILALGLVVPDANRKGVAKYTARDLVAFYQDNCAKIFRKNIFSQLIVGWGLWGPKYSRRPLDRILKCYMGNTMLSETLVPVAITSYSLDKACPHLWTTRVAKTGPEHDYRLSDVAGATSAAPVYFAPKIVYRSDGTSFREADGGLWANNPETIAAAELRNIQKDANLQDMVLVSVRTSLKKEANVSIPDMQEAGLIGWLGKGELISLMMDADEEWAEALVNTFYPNYYSIKVPIPVSQLDASSPRALRSLLAAAERYISEHTSEIEALCTVLMQQDFPEAEGVHDNSPANPK